MTTTLNVTSDLDETPAQQLRQDRPVRLLCQSLSLNTVGRIHELNTVLKRSNKLL